MSYKWLKELVGINQPSKCLADRISSAGFEVESIIFPGASLSKIVVGEVIRCDDVRGTRLHVCQVNVGEHEIIQIVCGAPNIAQGQKVPVALPGARIAGGGNIKKQKVMGLESNGMICSLLELGVSSTLIPEGMEGGICLLPKGAKNGEEVFDYLGLDDEIIKLSITPNRSDAFSMIGVAHEVAAIYDTFVRFKKFDLKEISEKTSDHLSVDITTEKCKNYQARVVRNVNITSSPQWLQNLLINHKIRPVNNVLDVANYILLYFGQPIHVFDFDQLRVKSIRICEASGREQLITLDGSVCSLKPTDIVVSVGGDPVSLAGVVGGEITKVISDTTTIVLEAAIFDGNSIHETSARLGIHSRSSVYFEKGVNHATVGSALDAAASLIAELAGGEVLSGIVSAGCLNTSDTNVSTSLSDVNRVLGMGLTYMDVAEVFRRLDFGFSGNGEQFTVNVPCRRRDITIPADLYEEIARIHGYNKLPVSSLSNNRTVGGLTIEQKLRRKIRTIAESVGLTEIISYTLTTPEKAIEFNMQPSYLMELMCPMTRERSVLRQNIVSSLLDVISYNIARKNTNLTFYEIGKVFKQIKYPSDVLPIEISKFAFAVTGLVRERDFQTESVSVDFFYAKGILESIFARLGVKVDYRSNDDLSSMHPGRTAIICLDGHEIGFVGQVHPCTAKAYSIPETYVAEIDLMVLRDTCTIVRPFIEISKYPPVNRDIAVLVDRDVSHQDIVDAIIAADIKSLVSIKLFDIYVDTCIELGKKSMAYRLTFQNVETNLTAEEVASFVKEITALLVSTVDAQLR